MVVMGKNISRATNYGNFPHEGDLFILCIYIVKEVFCLAISYWVSQHPPPPLLVFVENTQVNTQENTQDKKDLDLLVS